MVVRANRLEAGPVALMAAILEGSANLSGAPYASLILPYMITNGVERVAAGAASSG